MFIAIDISIVEILMSIEFKKVAVSQLKNRVHLFFLQTNGGMNTATK
jgi:hypothetical protein